MVLMLRYLHTNSVQHLMSWKNSTNNRATFENEFQSWWCLANFTYNPDNYKATAFVLTTTKASVLTIQSIIALRLNHKKTVLYPIGHSVWAHGRGDK